MERRAGFGYQTVCLGFTLPTRGDGALKISDESVLRSRGTRVEKGERRRARKKDAARSKANQESRHSKHKGARGIYAESEDPRWKNDEPKVCNRRGPLPEVKRENDRRNAPKRVSTLP